MVMTIFVVVGLFVAVAGHGLMTLPSPRTLSRRPSTLDRAVVYGDWGNNRWYSNNLGGAAGWLATKGARMRIPPGTPSNCRRGNTPWCAPGSSDILSPCGIYGGGLPCDTRENRDKLNNGRRITGASGCNPIDGRDIKKSPNQVKWRAGGVAKVGWGTQANHGGGVSYRLCPANATQDEACFQSNVLKFASNVSVIRWVTCPASHRCIRSGQEMVVPLRKVTTNTHPAGSEWATNPIGWPCPDCTTCAAPRVRRGTYIERNNCYKLSNHNLSMVDLVQVPNTPGKFTLSMRWDCSVNPQIWNNCADIEIVAEGSPEYPEPVEWPVPVESPYTSHVQFKCPAPNKAVILRMKPDSRWPDERSPYYPRDRYPEWLHTKCGSNVSVATAMGNSKPNPTVTEMPKPKPSACCTALTVECQACKEGMTVDEYCDDFCVEGKAQHAHCSQCPKRFAVQITSVNHKSRGLGKYFNMDWHSTTGKYAVKQCRNGVQVWSGNVVIWKNRNGGSTGNSHGRRDRGARHGQWRVGDVITDGICRKATTSTTTIAQVTSTSSPMLTPEPEPEQPPSTTPQPEPEPESTSPSPTPQPEEPEPEPESTSPSPTPEPEEPEPEPEPRSTCSICPEESFNPGSIAGKNLQGQAYTCQVAIEWLNSAFNNWLNCKQGASLWRDACCVGKSLAELDDSMREFAVLSEAEVESHPHDPSFLQLQEERSSHRMVPVRASQRFLSLAQTESSSFMQSVLRVDSQVESTCANSHLELAEFLDEPPVE